jgi:hypothetical protein
MDWIFALAIATFVLLLGFLWWNRASTKRHQESGGGNTTGIGGLNDPLSGTTQGMRDPDEMRAALDAAPGRNVSR